MPLTVEIPEGIERAIDDAVGGHLQGELGRRGLRLAADQMTQARRSVSGSGERLLVGILDHCFPPSRPGGPVAIGFDSPGTAERLKRALAFGSVVASALAATAPPAEVELVCAVFNVGIGLVDSLCDEERTVGAALLELVSEADLVDGAEYLPPAGWLGARLPPRLANDATAAFTVTTIEAFFTTLHAAYPEEAGAPVREGVAEQLVAALEAERVSAGLVGDPGPEHKLACSRLTSVLPFQIIETLVRGAHDCAPVAGTLLGEAMWRIDDLVDLCDDARCGALNSLLLDATGGSWPVGDESSVLAILEWVSRSTAIADAAAAAAESLHNALEHARGTQGSEHPAARALLGFIQDYAGIPPRPS